MAHRWRQRPRSELRPRGCMRFMPCFIVIVRDRQTPGAAARAVQGSMRPGAVVPGGHGTSMDASLDASFSSNGSVHVVRCSRLSGLLMRYDTRRWPVWRYADRVQNLPDGLESAIVPYWFSRSRLVDRLPLHVLRPAHIPDDFALASAASGSSRRKSAVALSFRHHRPGNARHPVGERYGNQLPGFACQHAGQPRAFGRAAPNRLLGD